MLADKIFRCLLHGFNVEKTVFVRDAPREIRRADGAIQDHIVIMPARGGKTGMEAAVHRPGPPHPPLPAPVPPATFDSASSPAACTERACSCRCQPEKFEPSYSRMAAMRMGRSFYPVRPPMRRVATGRTSVPRLGFRQAGELAKLADGVAREQFIDKLLVGLAVVGVLAALPAERQHELAHARVGTVLLVILAEVTDQPPALVVELDAVLLRPLLGELFAPVLGMEKKSLFVRLDQPTVHDHAHWHLSRILSAVWKAEA